MDVRVFSMDEYHKLLDSTFAKVVELGKLKGGEYSGDVDRLLNFRRNANDVGVPYEVVWRIYAGKHWDAITQYVQDMSRGKYRERLESLSGRCDDLILYLILFKGMVREQETEAQMRRPKVSKLDDPGPPSERNRPNETEYERAMNNARGDL